MLLDLRVRLKTVDLVRETAWLALRDKLGWDQALGGLERSTLWRFHAEAPAREPLVAALDRELEKSSTFYNPNKETRAFCAAGELGPGEALDPAEALSPGGAPAEGAWRVALWITDEGGAREDVRRRIAPSLAREGLSLERLEWGVLWELRLRAADAAQARGLAAGLALSRSRGEGLLANPHYQEARLVGLAPDGGIS